MSDSQKDEGPNPNATKRMIPQTEIPVSGEETKRDPMEAKMDTYIPEDIDDDEEISGAMKYIEKIQRKIGLFTKKNARWFRYGAYLLLAIAYHVYLTIALIHNFERAKIILILTSLVWIYLIYTQLILRFCGKYLDTAKDFLESGTKIFWRLRWLRIGCYLFVAGAILAFLIVDTSNDRSRLLGLGGMAFFVCLMFLTSAHPSRINWRPVLLGFLLQFIMGLLVLRWEWGGQKFADAADLVIYFLKFTDYGTNFVYGFLSNPPNICGMSAVFAFSSIQVVIYFGAVVSLLYHFGIMQAVLRSMAMVMQWTLGTTATESLNACACIFLGMSEAPLLIKPYLKRMTASELHALMTSGFSCIAGSLFAAYIAFGACPNYLLSATVMSAPGSLACSKILYPETEKSQLKNVEDLELPKGNENNALECISNGAIAAVELVMAILANLIVFLALLAFLDAFIGYLGDLVGIDGLSFDLILGYFFWPLAFIMGVSSDSAETLRVAQLMGTKTALNEFIAYQKLGQMVRDDLLSPKASMIATYALCGFSNFASIGIQMGVVGGMVPERKALLSRLALRALFAGCISCFMTASLAGVLVENPSNCGSLNIVSNCFNTTEYYELVHNKANALFQSPQIPSTSSYLTHRLEL